MAIWGTLRQRIGGATPADADAFVDEFFNKTKLDPSWELERIETQVREFISNQLADNRRGIALVTSGATIVPLDGNTDTFVDLSAKMQEHQGPACAEYLLSVGYAVIFLHREDSMQPFTRHFQQYIQNGAFMSMFHVREQGLVLEGLDLTQQVKFQNITLLYSDAKDRLLNLNFTTVQQYLMLLRLTSRAVSAAKNRAIVLLAATVMDFYVPIHEHDVAKKKRTTGGGEFSVNFGRVPNLIKRVRKEWCPQAFLVTLKHEFENGQMIEAAHLAVEKYGMDVIAGMYRHEYAREILLITEQEDTIVSCPADEDINDAFAAAIANMHRQFRKKREILQRGKQLLLLSAKFSMLKEKDLVNEDANGNKNVQFGPGVKICTDRRSGAADAPVYELKRIFQNKRRCARAHVWESSVAHASGGSSTDVVVAFSPAGNPETIRDVWGDFWSGWAENEISEFKQQMGTMSLTNALNVVTSSISGDYSPASAILQFMWSKIGSAWSDGEQTRIRQSIQNMMAVGLDRGLIEPTGITPLETLMARPRIRRFDSLALDESPPVSVSVHSHSRRRRRDSDEDSDISSDPARLSKAIDVRVHRAVHDYMQDMINDGLLDTIMEYVAQGAAVHVTGYSMGGMLGQLFMLYVGDRARMQGLDASKINFVGFGSPRTGDIGFAARLRLLFDPEQVLIVMHPSDTVHAFPPTAEGYADSAIKIFLKEDGLGVGRRTASPFSLLPMTRSIDHILEHAFKSSSTTAAAAAAAAAEAPNKEEEKAASGESECSLCQSKAHSSEQHRCRYCIERGTHRGAACPNRSKPCLLCGHANHCTGEHRCKVCQQYGHRGRECHAQRDVGLTELVTYFRFHHFLYYNSNLKKSVEFTAT